MKIIRITGRKEDADAFNRDIEQNSNNGKCFILHFFMKGCIHCENLEPKMKKVEKHMMSNPKYDNVTLGKIDADMMDSVNVENAYEFPTLKVVKNGETHHYKGPPEETAILTWINNLVKDSNHVVTKGVHLSNHNSLGRRSLQSNTNRANASGVATKKHKRKGRKHRTKKTRKMRKTKRENKSNKKNKRRSRTKKRASKKH